MLSDTKLSSQVHDNVTFVCYSGDESFVTPLLLQPALCGLFLLGVRFQLRAGVLNPLWPGFVPRHHWIPGYKGDSTGAICPTGHKSLLFLPPYSPELNPQEHLWDE